MTVQNGDTMNSNLERAILKNKGNPLQRVIKSPVLLPLSKIAERLCLISGSTMSLHARLFWGDKMLVEFPEIVSCFLYRYGYFEPDLTRIVMNYVKPGDVFFDIGTHFGYYSLLASHLVGSEGKVHCFEPTRNTYNILTKNLECKGNAVLNNVAMWSENKDLTFKDYGVAFSAFNSLYGAKLDEESLKRVTPKEYVVRAITVDDYVSRTNTKPNFIKIDAENAEYDIILGMVDVLRECRPVISLEVGDVNRGEFKTSYEAVQLLASSGYSPHEWRNNKIERHIPSEVYRHTNLLFLPN